MKKLNENQKKFLGTVPKKYQLVENFWGCPEISKTSNKGITLIALIITIIVMLILVGVTINVALNGGLFGKAKDATFKTKISQIQEGLLVKKAELVADNNGKEPLYNLKIGDLDIANELKNEYGSKLKIGADGKLYYDSAVVINTSEQNQLKEVGINEYVELSSNSYTFTMADIMKIGYEDVDVTRIIPVSDFWPEYISDSLKNSAFDVEFEGALCASNFTCSDSKFTNIFASGGDQNFEKDWIYYAGLLDDEIVIVVTVDRETASCGYLREDNYIDSGYEDLSFTIAMP